MQQQEDHHHEQQEQERDNKQRHVPKSISGSAEENVTRQKIRLFHVDCFEQKTEKRRQEESFERFGSRSSDNGVLLSVAELDSVSLDRFELATSKD